MPMNAIVSALMFVSVLIPAKGWFAPDQPIDVAIKSGGPEVTLFLTDFVGKAIDHEGPTEAADGKAVDIRKMYPTLSQPGTYILYAVPRGKANKEFVGTPLVIGVRTDTRRGAPTGAMVVKVEPLCYLLMNTEKGPLKMAFYYDVAPNTVASFLSLAQGGY